MKTRLVVVQKPYDNPNPFHTMTMIDPTTGWFEIASLRDGKTALEAQRLLDSVWLARYPRPREIGFDGGGEFKAEFRELCDDMGLKRRPSNAWNPQSNAIIERVHQVLGDNLRTLDHENAAFTGIIHLKNSSRQQPTLSEVHNLKRSIAKVKKFME